ncbi:repressor of RNA polymerase III transcription MAF1 homolog [Phoenix dactylifera]|uniref:Repressor of RNA polymerase III transcription n=1 Tax=Phoenix dactylifera TaxID=42345 RepID=A0A8B7C7P9_PHODC|nr:repressor of RNA polymerase III transcription MAF1 homolog [Phoenix dactylifera]
MKFLEYTPLDSINLFLNHLNLGESTIKGNLEAFSCKHTGTDRKLSLSLEHEILDYLGQSSDSDPSSPVEYLSSRSSRRTLIYLVLTLSHMYPDYDFSAIRAHLFFREEEWETFKQIYDTYLFEAAREWAIAHGGCSLLESMTKAIDEVVKLNECEIYSYNPDFDGDPFLEKGAIWSFNFFFYNRKLKRVVSFRCCCISNLATEGFLADEMFGEEEEEDLFIGMDM